MDLSSGLFDTSVGLFVNKEPVEARQLRETDFQREIDKVQLQLNQLARSHLLSSITFYREGVRHLFKLKSSSDGGELENADKQVEAYAGSSANPITKVCPALKDLRLSDLDDAHKRALLAAKKDFENARSEAIRAFNNESLPIFDRLQAMIIRVAATMLENVDHPEDALGVCVGCLEDLHGLQEIQENFSLEICRNRFHSFKKDRRRQIISSVCRINHYVRKAAEMIAKEGELLTFPLIEIEGGKVDPLHDHRLVKALSKQDMPHYVITPQSLGKKDEKVKPKTPQGIAVNSQDHCIVGDEWDFSVKEFDVDGTFLRQISVGEKTSCASLIDVATDSEDNVYILLRLEENPITVRFKMCVLDKEGNIKQEFLLREKTTEVLRMTVNNNNEIFVLTESSEIPGSAVHVYDSGGQFVRSFDKKTLHCPQDICAINNGRVIVLDRDDQCVLSVQMFYSNGQCIADDLLKSVEEAKKPIRKLRSSIACHRLSNVVVLALPSETGQDPVRILKYDMSEGKLLPSVDLPSMKGQISTRGVAVTTQGRIAIGLLDKDGGDSKVLII